MAHEKKKNHIQWSSVASAEFGRVSVLLYHIMHKLSPCYPVKGICCHSRVLQQKKRQQCNSASDRELELEPTDKFITIAKGLHLTTPVILQQQRSSRDLHHHKQQQQHHERRLLKYKCTNRLVQQIHKIREFCS